MSQPAIRWFVFLRLRFLVEDGEDRARRFRELGGQAYQYTTDEAFIEWLVNAGFVREAEAL